jgi:hypothetical protein
MASWVVHDDEDDGDTAQHVYAEVAVRRPLIGQTGPGAGIEGQQCEREGGKRQQDHSDPCPHSRDDRFGSLAGAVSGGRRRDRAQLQVTARKVLNECGARFRVDACAPVDERLTDRPSGGGGVLPDHHVDPVILAVADRREDLLPPTLLDGQLARPSARWGVQRGGCEQHGFVTVNHVPRVELPSSICFRFAVPRAELLCEDTIRGNSVHCSAARAVIVIERQAHPVHCVDARKVGVVGVVRSIDGTVEVGVELLQRPSRGSGRGKRIVSTPGGGPHHGGPGQLSVHCICDGGERGAVIAGLLSPALPVRVHIRCERDVDRAHAVTEDGHQICRDVVGEIAVDRCQVHTRRERHQRNSAFGGSLRDERRQVAHTGIGQWKGCVVGVDGAGSAEALGLIKSAVAAPVQNRPEVGSGLRREQVVMVRCCRMGRLVGTRCNGEANSQTQ